MRPVITSNHGQMKDVIDDGVNGLLCNNDPKDILEKILILKDDPDLAAMLGHNAWKCIQQEFNWQANVEKTLALFEDNLTKFNNQIK